MQQIFHPPAELLRSISFEEKLPHILFVPTFNAKGRTEETHEMGNAYMKLVKGVLTSKYAERFTKEHFQLIYVNLFIEQFRDCAKHGNGYDPSKYVMVGIWLGENGIMFAFRDEGEFFSRIETKEKFESRTLIPSTSVPMSGMGLVLLYKAAKDIYVATEENTLYVTYMI